MIFEEKLNKILEFLIANKDRNDVSYETIQQDIFYGSITMNEAIDLLDILSNSNVVGAFGIEGRLIGANQETEAFLVNGGFMEEGITSSKDGKVNKPVIGSHNIRVFISYAWGDDQHEEDVLRLYRHLRKNGVDAKLDKAMSQEKTAINFTEMMITAMQFDKVIVILSENYKKKADTFSGGVGTEFRLLVNDIGNNHNKYILASFTGHDPKVIPFALQGYDIVNFSGPNWEETLFRKITGELKYEELPVSGKIPRFGITTIGEFLPSNIEFPVELLSPLVQRGDISYIANAYRRAYFTLQFVIHNISGHAIDKLSYEIKIKRDLFPERFDEPAEDGYLQLNYHLENGIYPHQQIRLEKLVICVNSGNAQKVINSPITVTVYTASGPVTRSFQLPDIIKMKRVPGSYGVDVPISIDLFR